MAAASAQQHRHPKRRRLALSLSLSLSSSPTPKPVAPPLDTLADELLFLVLDRVAQADPRALKSFALASRACLAAESRHRRTLRPLRADLLHAALVRYPCATRLDLSLCARPRRRPRLRRLLLLLRPPRRRPLPLPRVRRRGCRRARRRVPGPR
ncbi:unnamed protein product [Miscanthus lutarioriparius]|uniref:F-box domain-containing protein n=1 Tax=Miscanthus lutarioriparius TaxID=422564 RepID=A0A811Q411_9POAL|nr:unnamed protein product [Miscanthus lutarioriparius]